MREAGLWLCGLYLLGINLLAFLAFGRDKALARQGRFRIPEARLLLYAALGGSAGAWLGMRRFHHKTKKWRFRIAIPALFLTQVGIIIYIIAILALKVGV
jgi:uncharacterized membrane protein YsdA (DUF1294 family)